jgi:hypothetical protein
MFGNSTKNISANELVWGFFEKHPMNQERSEEMTKIS